MGCGVWGVECGVWNEGSRMWSLEIGVCGPGFRVQGIGRTIEGFELSVYGSILPHGLRV